MNVRRECSKILNKPTSCEGDSGIVIKKGENTCTNKRMAGVKEKEYLP